MINTSNTLEMGLVILIGLIEATTAEEIMVIMARGETIIVITLLMPLPMDSITTSTITVVVILISRTRQDVGGQKMSST